MKIAVGQKGLHSSFSSESDEEDHSDDNYEFDDEERTVCQECYHRAWICWAENLDKEMIKNSSQADYKGMTRKLPGKHTLDAKSITQPTIFEAFNFFIKKLFTPLDLCVSSCWVAVFPPSSACSRIHKVTITCIRGQGSAENWEKEGGPPYKHSLSQRPTRVTY